VGIPRDGGLAALLAEAKGPSPRFAAVMCEDIERSGRDTFNALKLERQLADAGIPLLATDEPISMEGMNATTVLIRRVKQGIAEWYRFQLKEKAWGGMVEHSMAGWNTGPAPYGYTAQTIPHPVAVKAAQGRTKSRLILDPDRAPVVAQMFTWRVRDHLGINTITDRLNADHAAYPPPNGQAWITSGVAAILANPKYTGYMVFGRRRKTGRRFRYTPPAEWLWSPQPAHPAIITRDMWDAAQQAGPAHASSRDSAEPAHPAARRTYDLRSRVRCRICQRRMCGITRPSSRYYTTGDPDALHIYYMCPHNPQNPRHAAAAPDHPRTVSVREDTLLTVVREFFATRIFGPERAALLTAQIPATDADATAQAEKKTAALHQRLRQIDAAENAHTREIEALACEQDPYAPAVKALRKRTIERFTELENERASIETKLAALTKTARPSHPGLLDLLPQLAGLLADAPARLEHQLYDAFDLQILYNNDMHQVTIWATITDSTPRTVTDIIGASDDGPPATTPPPPASPHISDSPQHPRRPPTHRDHGRPGRLAAMKGRPRLVTVRVCSPCCPAWSRNCPAQTRTARSPSARCRDHRRNDRRPVPSRWSRAGTCG
jgi:site-specific DNA recombinase